MTAILAYAEGHNVWMGGDSMNGVALRIDPDDLALMRSCYTDERKVQCGAYEMAYYEVFGVLPDNAVVIERVEECDGGRLWIHRDPDSVQ